MLTISAYEVVDELASDEAGACNEQCPRERLVRIDAELVCDVQQSAPHGAAFGVRGWVKAHRITPGSKDREGALQRAPSQAPVCPLTDEPRRRREVGARAERR